MACRGYEWEWAGLGAKGGGLDTPVIYLGAIAEFVNVVFFFFFCPLSSCVQVCVSQVLGESRSAQRV